MATALNSVLLSWTASVSPNLTSYNLYRGTTSGGPYSVVTAVGLVTTYTDYNVQFGQTYYYVATAIDNTGTESAYSSEASAAVPGPVPQGATIRLCVSPLMAKPGIIVQKICGLPRAGAAK
jgi:fibronectin type 3 domain-containing protein